MIVIAWGRLSGLALVLPPLALLSACTVEPGYGYGYDGPDIGVGIATTSRSVSTTAAEDRATAADHRAVGRGFSMIATAPGTDTDRPLRPTGCLRFPPRPDALAATVAAAVCGDRSLRHPIAWRSAAHRPSYLFSATASPRTEDTACCAA